MPLNIANLLTLFRIALIPVFVLIFFLPFHWTPPATMAIFALASITDWFDGFLARRLNLGSPFGAFLDPVADKLMIATALVLLVMDVKTGFPAWCVAVPAAIIIGREITISALREWMAEMGERTTVAVSFLGKFKTAIQMIAVGFLLYRWQINGIPIYTIGLVLLFIAAILTLWSMYIYLRAAWPQMQAST